MDTSSLVTLTFNWMSKLMYGSSNNEPLKNKMFYSLLLQSPIPNINGYEN